MHSKLITTGLYKNVVFEHNIETRATLSRNRVKCDIKGLTVRKNEQNDPFSIIVYKARLPREDTVNENSWQRTQMRGVRMLER